MSKFQGDIDWNAVANSGVKFAWIKATEGGDRDARFQANWEGAKAAGIPHGAYHFVYWCRPPLEEIQIFEQIAPVEDDALPPVLDVEATPTSPTCHRRLTQDGAIADMQVMLREMERHYGKRPIIYTTVDFYQAILSDGALMDYPIWVRSTKHHPAVKYGSRAWHFWQYQSDGRVPGIGGNVDKDAFYGSKEQWDAFLREPGVRPAQTTAAQPQDFYRRTRQRPRGIRRASSGLEHCSAAPVPPISAARPSVRTSGSSDEMNLGGPLISFGHPDGTDAVHDGGDEVGGTASILAEAVKLVGRDINTEKLIDELEQIHAVDLGLGAPVTFGENEHQGSHKVWGTQLDETGHYQPIDLR